jgi:hypothetical protein
VAASLDTFAHRARLEFGSSAGPPANLDRAAAIPKPVGQFPGLHQVGSRVCVKEQVKGDPVDCPCDHWTVLVAASQVGLLQERIYLNAFLRPLTSEPIAAETVALARLR